MLSTFSNSSPANFNLLFSYDLSENLSDGGTTTGSLKGK